LASDDGLVEINEAGYILFYVFLVSFHLLFSFYADLKACDLFLGMGYLVDQLIFSEIKAKQCEMSTNYVFSSNLSPC
jgi:hypothetical protein